MNSLTQTQVISNTTQVILHNPDNGEQLVKEIKNEPPKEEKKKKKPTNRIQWQEDTIDNEHLGRLKSNLCCIYHKPKNSENPSSDTCTSDDDGNELDRDRTTKKRHKKACSKFESQNEDHNHHDHSHCHNHKSGNKFEEQKN